MDKRGNQTFRTLYKTRKLGGRVDSALPGTSSARPLSSTSFWAVSREGDRTTLTFVADKSCGLLDRHPCRHPAPNPVSKHLVAKAGTILTFVGNPTVDLQPTAIDHGIGTVRFGRIANAISSRGASITGDQRRALAPSLLPRNAPYWSSRLIRTARDSRENLLCATASTRSLRPACAANQIITR
jgi:hypothetical protein